MEIRLIFRNLCGASNYVCASGYAASREGCVARRQWIVMIRSCRIAASDQLIPGARETYIGSKTQAVPRTDTGAQAE